MPPAIVEEIARFKLGAKKYTELSNEAQDALKADWLAERVGFEPDFMFRASGVTMNNRQAVLSKTRRLKDGPRTKIPIEIRRENNKHDEYALAIYLPTVVDAMGDYHAWEHAGYVPRGLCPHCGNTLTGPILESHDTCPKCKGQIYEGTGADRHPTNERVEFNKFIFRLLEEGKISYGLDNILSDPNKPDLNTGLSIAIKIS